MSHVLVTGHLGFVGQHLVRAFDHSYVGIDLKDGEDLLDCDLPDNVARVYHLAAQTNAQFADSYCDAEVNVLGTLRLLEKYGERVVLASTSMVNYPMCPYAISKRAAEDYARYYHAAIVRFPNLYGEGGHSVVDRFDTADVIEIRGSGEQRRTYAHVSEAVRALLGATPGVTTIVSGATLTVNQVARQHPNKPRIHVPASAIDLSEVVQ